MNSNKLPLVSVLMTAYNREKYIEEAIESVIASSCQDWELIIVDDCSSDRTVEIAKSYESKDKRIKVYVNEKNLGQFPNRNKAASLAKGKYIKYLDSDDIIYPHGLEVMVSALEKFPQAGMGFTFNNYNNEKRFPFTYSSFEAFEYHFFKAGLMYIGPSGCIYNRQIFAKLGGFGEYGVASDYEYNLRVCMRNLLVLLPRDLVWWRTHEGQEISLRENEYIKMNYRIHQSIINHIDCPLPEKRRRETFSNIDRNYMRKALFSALKFRFKKAFILLELIKSPLRSFIYALIPGFILKRS